MTFGIRNEYEPKVAHMQMYGFQKNTACPLVGAKMLRSRVEIERRKSSDSLDAPRYYKLALNNGASRNAHVCCFLFEMRDMRRVQRLRSALETGAYLRMPGPRAFLRSSKLVLAR